MYFTPGIFSAADVSMSLMQRVRMRRREELHVQQIREPNAARVLRFAGEPRNGNFRQRRQRLCPTR